MTKRPCPVDPPEPEWLDKEQQGVWRRYLMGSMLLTEQLDRDLRADHALSLAEYEVLVHLSESNGWQLRMAELAELTNQSRSRLSHTVDRMQRDGLVARFASEADRRGVWAGLTDEGFARLEKAARTHVAGVRKHFVDQVEPADFDALGRAFGRVIEGLKPTTAQYAAARPGEGAVG